MDINLLKYAIKSGGRRPDTNLLRIDMTETYNWVADMLKNMPEEWNTPMTDEEFDAYMGSPIGTTRYLAEQEYFKKVVALCSE